MGIGSILQQLLTNKGTNVNEVSVATGVSPSTLYSMIKRDSTKASIADLYKIAHHLDVDLDYFYNALTSAEPPIMEHRSVPFRLREFRESLNMTQKEFAASLSIGHTTYNGYETGARDPKSDFWIAVAKKYGVTIDYLMGYSNNPHKTSVQSDGSTQSSAQLPTDALEIAKGYSRLDQHGKRIARMVIEEERNRMELEKRSSGLAVEDAMDPSRNVIYLMHNSEKASAGKGFYLDGHEQMERWVVELNELTRQADFCVDIQGDSMEPRFSDEDTVLVRAQPSVNIGEIGLFSVDGAGFIKRQRADCLESINENYDDIPLDTNITIKCFGRVIGILEDEWIVEK